MQHDWIFDVLKDLSDYARRNGLVALAQKAEETLRVAETEIAAAATEAETDGGEVPPGRHH